jgi:hypothetical protein
MSYSLLGGELSDTCSETSHFLVQPDCMNFTSRILICSVFCATKNYLVRHGNKYEALFGKNAGDILNLVL